MHWIETALIELAEALVPRLITIAALEAVRPIKVLRQAIVLIEAAEALQPRALLLLEALIALVDQVVAPLEAREATNVLLVLR
ncbi:hypothetical protein GCM10007383_11450 [Arenibacter certesii]|uniref:Uncharacterized protein n=1 Tax=Arenibacter certesii TaxID=228955 RepID=A0A918MJF3_9FLAO|nr:hypothetical protein GCM10007383_11450 [Arenibacter certesii]